MLSTVNSEDGNDDAISGGNGVGNYHSSIRSA